MQSLHYPINAFAQNKQPMLKIHHPSLNSKEDIQGMLEDKALKEFHLLNSKSQPIQVITQQTLQPLSLIPIIDSIYLWQLDSISMLWVFKSKLTNIIYNDNHYVTSLIEQTFNGSAWINLNQHTYTYDANNRMISELIQTWNGSAWVSSEKYSCTYDANNNLINELWQEWNGSALENSKQYLYTYDSNKNQISETRQNWNGNAWENVSKMELYIRYKQ